MLLHFGYRIMNLQYSKYILFTECTNDIIKMVQWKLCVLFLVYRLKSTSFDFLFSTVPFMTSKKNLRICFFSILEHILHGTITTTILIESRECLYTILCIVFVAKRTLYVIGKWKHKRSIKKFFFGQVHSHNNEENLK